ncbi:hypothetical protein BDZ89DRAFT_1083079 [Hymenopellis radicata]|nr:hypothetical protein BDZ89DRAFT_1083079 [Hymenopellis radicata]
MCAFSSARALLAVPPSSIFEEELQEALRDAEARMNYWKGRATQLQSQAVLQELYVKRVRRQLAQKEARKKKAKNFRLKEGVGRLLTADEVIEEISAHEEETRQKAKDKDARKVAKEDRAARLAKEVAVWENEEKQRKERNDALLRAWAEDVVRWEDERDQAKREKRRAAWRKPPGLEGLLLSIRMMELRRF